MNNPLVSVIIPAKNAQKRIRACVDSVLNLAYQPYEVIVVNDGSTDETLRILSEYPKIRVLNTAGLGSSRARNIAVQEAAGELIAFTDADCRVAPDWLTELLKGFSDALVAGVGGRQESPADESGFGRVVQDFLQLAGFISGYMQSGRQIQETQHNPSCNVMYRKSVLLEMGGFLAGLWPGEDVELDYRIKKKGYSLRFNPGALVFHYRPDNLKDFSRMMARYGWAQGELVKKYGIFRKAHFIPLLTLLLILLLWVNPTAGLWALALLIIALFIRSRLGCRRPFLILGLVLVALARWNLGFLAGLIRRQTLNTR
ncbi:MAG: glycosyltransferase [Candidatus Omnitrophica bacterium]|nr:glycosyltransferase [Candidatus Omnitrophota bacterium]